MIARCNFYSIKTILRSADILIKEPKTSGQREMEADRRIDRLPKTIFLTRVVWKLRYCLWRIKKYLNQTTNSYFINKLQSKDNTLYCFKSINHFSSCKIKFTKSLSFSDKIFYFYKCKIIWKTFYSNASYSMIFQISFTLSLEMLVASYILISLFTIDNAIFV